MNILEQAISNFESRPLLSVVVPEWSSDTENPVVVYYRTPNAKLLSRVQKQAGTDLIEQAARIVALVACDKDGKRHFTESDYTTLMISTDPAGISRVAAAILQVAKLDVTAAEKN
jgi:intracellular sulfur oxidation DsrE/DsrF family protein